MFCTNCGEELPDDANFCWQCGTPVSPGGDGEGAPDDTTTSALEVGVLEEREDVGEIPELEAGTGMLVVIRGPNAGSRFLLDRELTTVGRHPESHLFLDDVTVSRRHAEIRNDDGALTIRDLGSLNGTYVNGDRVEERTLRTGDEVQVGRFKLVFLGSESDSS